MGQHSIKYRTFDQLLEDVSIDFSQYSLEGMIEPQQLIKIATRVNYDLGLRIHQTKEVVLEVEHGKVKLPSDFYVLNFGMMASKRTITQPEIHGSHIHEVVIGPKADCVPTAPTTTTTTSTDTTETTTGATEAVTETVEHPEVLGGFNGYTTTTTTASASQVAYNSNSDEFLLVQAYSNPTSATPVSASDASVGTTINYSREWRNFYHIPELGVFVAGSPGTVKFMGLFSDTDYSLITEVQMVDSNGTGAWYFAYDADNNCVWAMEQYNTKRYIRVNITSTTLTPYQYTDLDSLGAHTSNAGLIYYNNKVYRLSYSGGGSVSQGFNSDITICDVSAGFPNGATVERYTNGNGIWYSAGYTYKPQPRGEKVMDLDPNTGKLWIRFEGYSAPVSYIFTFDPSDGSWDHIKDLTINNYTDGSLVYDSFGNNIIYTNNTSTEVLDIATGQVIETLAIQSADLAVASNDGDVLIATGNANGNSVYGEASYEVATPAWTETIIVTPANPGTTTSTTSTNTTTTTSGVDELYQCQPEGSCINQCGEYYQLVQTFKTKTVTYEQLDAIKIKPGSSVSADCPNTRWSSPYQAEIRNGWMYTSFKTGKVYINYLGAMENEEGELLVMDHPMVNEYYEYAVKQRILENLYMNGEDVAQKMNLIEGRLRGARNNALSYVNTPNFGELKKMWEVNRKAQYHKYVNMFKSFPTVG